MELEPNYNSGLFEFKIKDGGKVEKITTPINLKSFYMDLHDMFLDKNFLDMLNDPDGEFFDYQTKPGEFTDNKANLNRTADMFEKKFYFIKHSGGAYEIEILWKARKKSEITPNGWFEVKIDLVCRFIKDIDILDSNNNKIKLQSGSWEFRNEVVYKNDMVKKYLHKIPFVKNHQFLQKMYFQYLYLDKIEFDIEYGINKVLKPIYDVMNKHFKTNF